jgi:hypothetical protein
LYTSTIRLLTAILAAVSVAGAVDAQGPAPAAETGPPKKVRPSRPRLRAHKLSILRLPPALEARLDLTTDQKSRIELVRAQARQEVEALTPKPEPGVQLDDAQKEERRAKLIAAVRPKLEAAEAQAEAMLTAEQKRRYAELQSAFAPLEGLGEPGFALLMVDGLTDDQRVRLKALADSADARRRDLAAAARQKGEPTEPDEEQKARKEQEEQALADIAKVLTPEQQKQLDLAMKTSVRRYGPGLLGPFPRHKPLTKKQKEKRALKKAAEQGQPSR